MWILPTLSRPKQCAEVLRRIKDSGAKSEGIVFLNDHSLKSEYAKIQFPEGWRLQSCDRNLGALGALNCIFEHYPDEPCYGFIADDEFLLPESPPDWDKRLIETAGAWNIAHGLDDVHNGKRMQGYVVIGGDLVRTVGYLAIPECFHWYGYDCMWEWLGTSPVFGGGGALDILLVPEVKVEHRHAYWGKAPMDKCYELGASRSEEDRQVFIRWQKEQLPIIAERIKKARPQCASHI